MSKIDDLIAELCPEGLPAASGAAQAGVEYRELGEVALVKTGQSINKVYIQNNPGSYPVINSGKEPLGYIDKYNTENDPIGITSRGAGVGSVIWTEGKYFRGNLNYSMTLNNKVSIIQRFLYHWLLQYQYHIHALCTFDGIPALNASSLKTLKIPVPPLEVQREIVDILDKFTQLEAELEAELEARKKQYEHYRNQLLTFADDEVEWKTLGEVTVSTNNIKWKETNEEYLYIDLSSVSRDTNQISDTTSITSANAPSRAQKIVLKDDIIFATTRPTLQRYAVIDDSYDGQIASTGYCVLRAKSGEVSPKWIYYNIAKTSFNDYVESNQEGSAYPAISDKKVKEFKIPVPPLAEQNRIVKILDKFDALVSDISVGLPAEMAARRKQYEYYRAKLLDFPERQKEPANA